MDMEKAGIHLPGAQRARMQELMNLNQHFGMAFNTNLVSRESGQLGRMCSAFSASNMLMLQGNPKALGTVDLDGSEGEGSRGIWSRLKGGSGGSGRVPLDSQTMNHVLVTEPSEAIRKKASRGDQRMCSTLSIVLPHCP